GQAASRGWPAWAPAAVAGVLVALAAIAWVPSARHLGGSADTSDQRAIDGARGWVLANLPSRPRLAVDDAMWAALVDAGYPVDQLAPVGGLGPDRAGWPGGWAECRYTVGRDRVLLGADPADAARLARQSSSPVAAFGEGDDRVEVRRVVTDPDAAAEALRDASTRIDAGAGLARNPKLGLQPGAAALLRRGAVDSRPLSVLAAISGQHALTVVDFPAVPGEDPRLPRRLVAVSTIDGEPARAGATVVTTLDQWLRAQQPPYRPAGTELSDEGGTSVLVVRFDALGATGLLPP
ncbi:MAG TPA: hypothetical protein VEL73_00725, partial [Mycobacteriales bacterium]|nr:hypothetical protein [Mycobacteriales bacterium]